MMDKETRSHMLAIEPIGRLLTKLSVPAIIGMMVQALYNIIDAVFVGRYTGTLGIGGVSIAFPLQLIFISTGVAIGTGGASIISRRLGENNRPGASLALGNMFITSLLVGITGLILGLIFRLPLLRLFGATDALMPYAEAYFVIILLGAPLMTFPVAINAAARAEGNTRVAMNSMVIGAILNIVMDYLFIVRLGMGVKGAALATVFSMGLSAIYILGYFMRGKSELSFKPAHMRPDLPTIRETFTVGSSELARMAAGSLTFAVFNNILRSFGGETSIATFGILFRIMSFAFLPMVGIAQGAQPIIGFNYGAKMFSRVRKGLRLAHVSAAAVSLAWLLCFLVFSRQVFGIFTTEPALIGMGCKALMILALGLPLIGYQVVSISLFQALGKSRPAFILSVMRQVIFTIPLVFFLPPLLGLTGVWLAFPAGDVIAFMITVFMVRIAIKELPLSHNSQIRM